MKKIFLLLTIASLFTSSCSNDEETMVEEISLETQNSYDDAAAQKFLNDNYLDQRGNIVPFNSSITTDDNETPLSGLNPVKLASGVIYISKNVPAGGKTIAAGDKIRWMVKSNTYVAIKEEEVIKFGSAQFFKNTVAGTGIPEADPAYFYVKTSVLNKFNTDNKTTKTRSFYEIEGLQEALRLFKSYEIPDSENYTLQGVIIVPSRAAFARDEHFPYATYAFDNRSFVFNFQVYKTDTRTSADD